MQCFIKKEDRGLIDVDNFDIFATTSARRLTCLCCSCLEVTAHILRCRHDFCDVFMLRLLSHLPGVSLQQWIGDMCCHLTNTVMNTIEQFNRIRSSEWSTFHLHFFYIMPNVFEAGNIYKNPPQMSFHISFFYFYFALGLPPPMTLLPAGDVVFVWGTRMVRDDLRLSHFVG